MARNDLFPLAIGGEMEKWAKKRGLDVVMFEKYAIGTMDHASAITQMRAAKPDWIFATGYINDLILIRKQMNDLGVSAPVLTMIAGPAYKEFIDANGPLAETYPALPGGIQPCDMRARACSARPKTQQVVAGEI